jgi:imidazolonepropionase-like amidohydrolase
LTLRARAARGELLSPRLYVAAGPWGTTVLQAKTAGYDLFKLYGADGEYLDSIVAVARRVGMPIAGHAPSYEDSARSLNRAIAVGYASIEHLTGYDLYLGADKGGWWWRYWEDATVGPQQARQLLAAPGPAKLRAIATAMQQAGVWNCPTLAMFEATLESADQWPETPYLVDSTLNNWRTEEKQTNAPTVRPTVVAALAVRRAIVKALQEAGAGLLLGTDSPVPFMLPGFGVHHELQSFVRAGLSPYEALATGTRNVAQYLGTLDSSGTIAVGKRADLVLLRGDPLRDIRHTAQPAGVMLGGRWLDRAALDRGLAPLKGKLSTMTASPFR